MPPGRPTKLTPKVREAICQALRAGNYLEPSAIMNGVSKVSVYAWIKRGAKERARLSKSKRARPKRKESPFVLFLNAIEKAQAVAECRDVAYISKAGLRQWKAAAWRLTHKNPKRWGRKDQPDPPGGGGVVEASLVVTFVKADSDGV